MHNTKRNWKKLRVLAVVKPPRDDSTTTIPANKSREPSTNKDAESVGAKLTPCESNCIRSDLASEKLSICGFALKAKVSCLRLQKIIWVMKWIGYLRMLQPKFLHKIPPCENLSLRRPLVAHRAHKLRCLARDYRASCLDQHVYRWMSILGQIVSLPGSIE